MIVLERREPTVPSYGGAVGDKDRVRFINPEYSSRLTLLFAGTFAFLAFVVGDAFWEYYHDIDFSAEQSRLEGRRAAEQVRVAVESFVGEVPGGGKRLQIYIENINRKSDIKVKVFRGESINAQYGSGAVGPLPKMDETKLSLVDGGERDWMTGQSFFYAMPLKATEKCGLCHHLPGNPGKPVPEGSILAVLKVEVPATLLMESRAQLLKHTFIAVGFTLLAVVLLLYAIYRLVSLLRLSERSLSAIIKSVGEGIIVVNGHSVILSTNDELCRIFGYAEEELAGRDVKDLMPEKYRARHVAAMGRYLAGGPPTVLGRHVVLEGLRKDGSVFPLEMRIEETVGGEGEGRRFTAAIRDVTRRVAAEEALRESGEKFRSAFEDAAIGMVMADTQGTILRANPAMAKMLGYLAAELAGMTVADISHPDDMKVNMENIGRLLAGEVDSFQMEKRYLRKDGRTVWGLLNVSLMRDAEGRPYQLIAQVEDINKRKQAEEELIHAKEIAEEATKLKDKYVSLVSHDLKGPLTGMLGFLALLERHIEAEKKSPFSDGAKLLLDSAIMTGRNMTALIDELLDIGRMRTGKIKLNPRFTGAHALVARVVDDLRNMADKKGVPVHNKVPPHARIYADPLLLVQVIQNLVSNAIKFSHPGAAVSISIPEGERSVIEVADSGVGIKLANVDDIFVYEKKISTVGTGGEWGTGLGLPLSKEIVEAHGGTISVSSVAGRSTVFSILLPYVKPLVLLVDFPAERTAHKKNLEDLDVDFMEAADVAGALALIERRPPHLIIANIAPPLMAGFDLLESLKGNPATETIPVMVVTGDPGLQIRERALRLGADDFVGADADHNEFILRASRFLGINL